MFLKKKPEKSSSDFWKEYEEKTGEKVLARGLGKYISGWDEFDKNKWGGIWGLLITTDGGFRFHNFPQNNWIDNAFQSALTRFAEKEPPREKSLFLPGKKIVSTDFLVESKWWKKLLSPSPPHLVVKYLDEDGNERKLLFEAEYTAGEY